MSDPQRPATDDADRRKAAEVRAELDATVARAKQAFQHHVKQARERLAYAEGRLRLWEDRRQQLAGLEGDQRGAFHLQNAKLLVRMYEAMRRMLEVEAAAHQANLDVVGTDDVPDYLALRSPDDDPAYHESRRRIDHYLALFLWRVNAEGIDAALRAAGAGQALDPFDDADAALHAARAADVRAAMAADPELGRLVAFLGTELAEAQALMTWSTGALKRYESLDGAARRSLIGSSEWARLNGKLALLRDLHARTAAWPVLGRWFPAPDPAALPYPEASEFGTAAAPSKPAGPDTAIPPSQGRASALKLDARPMRRQGDGLK